MKKTLAILVLFILPIALLSTVTGQAYACTTNTTPTVTSLKFDCTAGYKIFPNIYVIDTTSQTPLGVLGIDAYHVWFSNFGSNYNIVVYSAISSDSSGNMIAIPIAMYTNNHVLSKKPTTAFRL